MQKMIGAILGLVCFLQPLSLDGWAFVRDKGKGFISLEYWSYCTIRYWNKQGKELLSGNHFQKYEANLYSEYGLTDKDTLFGQGLYDWIRESAHGRTTGLEDPEIGWRRQIFKKDDLRSTFEMRVIVPSGPNNRPSLRYGRCGVQAGFSQGGNFKFKDRDGFWDFDIGYRWYQGYPSDQVRAAATVGYDACKKVQLIADLHLEYGVYNGKPQTAGVLIVQDPNYRLLKANFLTRYRVTPSTSLVIGYYRNVWGRNTGTGGGFHGGIWKEF